MRLYQLSLFLLLLAGCTPEVSDWTPAESPKENKVERAVFSHFVYYPEKANEFEEIEKKRLLRFLKTTVLRPSAVTVILVEYGGRSKKRVKDIVRELIKYGISYDLIVDDNETGQSSCSTSKRSQKGQESGVEVIVERFVVIPPECADFSQPIGTARQEYSHSNFGCADAVNMGMMIANPRDLILGRPMGDSDGQVIAEGVRRYRTDKVKKLIDVSTNVDPGQLGTQTQSILTTPTGGGTGSGAY